MRFSVSATPDTLTMRNVIRTRAERPPPCADGEREQQVRPPHDGVAEVVRVTRVAPQPAVHHLAAVRRVGEEARELLRRRRPRTRTRRSTRDRRRIEQPERTADHRGRGEQRDRDQPREHGLQEEHGDEAASGERVGPAPAHRGVARVLAVAPVAPRDEDRTVARPTRSRARGRATAGRRSVRRRPRTSRRGRRTRVPTRGRRGSRRAARRSRPTSRPSGRMRSRARRARPATSAIARPPIRASVRCPDALDPFARVRRAQLDALSPTRSSRCRRCPRLVAWREQVARREAARLRRRGLLGTDPSPASVTRRRHC
jgi:hypothetical protein